MTFKRPETHLEKKKAGRFKKMRASYGISIDRQRGSESRQSEMSQGGVTPVGDFAKRR